MIVCVRIVCAEESRLIIYHTIHLTFQEMTQNVGTGAGVIIAEGAEGEAEAEVQPAGKPVRLVRNLQPPLRHRRQISQLQDRAKPPSAPPAPTLAATGQLSLARQLPQHEGVAISFHMPAQRWRRLRAFSVLRCQRANLPEPLGTR